MSRPESDAGEVVDDLRQAAIANGLDFAIAQAQALAVGGIAFVVARGGSDVVESFLRELLAALPKH